AALELRPELLGGFEVVEHDGAAELLLEVLHRVGREIVRPVEDMKLGLGRGAPGQQEQRQRDPFHRPPPATGTREKRRAPAIRTSDAARITVEMALISGVTSKRTIE